MVSVYSFVLEEPNWFALTVKTVSQARKMPECRSADDVSKRSRRLDNKPSSSVRERTHVRNREVSRLFAPQTRTYANQSQCLHFELTQHKIQLLIGFVQFKTFLLK